MVTKQLIIALVSISLSASLLASTPEDSNPVAEHIGRLEVICGPMFSGKSTELINRLVRAQVANKKVIAFKHSLDTRMSTDHIDSHARQSFPAILISKPEDILKHLPRDTDVVGFDETQFLPKEILLIVRILQQRNIRVITVGLETDFKLEGFGPMPELLARATSVTKLVAVCSQCHKENASTSQRLINGQPAHYKDEVVKVGAKEMYEARCIDCHKLHGAPWFKPKEPVGR